MQLQPTHLVWILTSCRCPATLPHHTAPLQWLGLLVWFFSAAYLTRLPACLPGPTTVLLLATWVQIFYPHRLSACPLGSAALPATTPAIPAAYLVHGCRTPATPCACGWGCCSRPACHTHLDHCHHLIRIPLPALPTPLTRLHEHTTSTHRRIPPGCHHLCLLRTGTFLDLPGQRHRTPTTPRVFAAHATFSACVLPAACLNTLVVGRAGYRHARDVLPLRTCRTAGDTADMNYLPTLRTLPVTLHTVRSALLFFAVVLPHCGLRHLLYYALHSLHIHLLRILACHRFT